jgi:hypothetical protein
LLDVSCEALAIEAETFRGVVAMSEFDDIDAELAQTAPMLGVHGVERSLTTNVAASQGEAAYPG